MTIISNVAVILSTDPETRDNFDKLYKQYFFIYGDCDPIDFFKVIPSINTARKTLQYRFPHIRGNERDKRIKCSNKFKKNWREQEKPENLEKVYEDCSNMFEPIKFEKETFLQSLFRKFF